MRNAEGLWAGLAVIFAIYLGFALVIIWALEQAP